MRQSTKSDMQIIQALQNQLAKKNDQINAYKQIAMPQNHLHSEENILDDLDEDEDMFQAQMQRQCQYPVFSQNNSQSELTPYKMGSGRSGNV